MKLSPESPLRQRIHSGLHSTAVLILPLFIFFNFVFYFAAEFSPLRSSLIDPEAEPPALLKLKELEEEPGLNSEKHFPCVMIFSSSLMMTPALFADSKYCGVPAGPLNETYKSYLGFQCLENALNQKFLILNMAAPALMISENVLFLETILSRGYLPKIIILAIAPRDFIDRTVGPFQESPTADILIDRLTGENVFNSAMPLSLRARLFILARRHFPLFKFRARLRDVFESLISSRSTSPPIIATLSDIRLDESRQKEDLEYYRKRYLPIDMNRWQRETACLREFKQICEHKNISLILLAMPLSKPNYVLLPSAFRELYRNELKALANCPGRVKLVDLTQDDNFTPEDFTDSVHLRSDGGLKLTGVLKKVIDSCR